MPRSLGAGNHPFKDSGCFKFCAKAVSTLELQVLTRPCTLLWFFEKEPCPRAWSPSTPEVASGLKDLLKKGDPHPMGRTKEGVGL